MPLFYIFIQDYQTRSYLGWCTLEEFKDVRTRYPHLQMSPILASVFEEAKDNMLHCSLKQIQEHPEIGELLKVYNDKESARQARAELNNLSLSTTMKYLKRPLRPEKTDT